MAASGAAGASADAKLATELGLAGKRDREDETESPLALLDKATVLQECRVFNDAQFVQQHPKRCCMQLTKLLFLLSQGERFSGAEADDVFFGVTKLFQSSDHNLRRMVYIFLKEMTAFTDPEHMIIVVASLVKDMNDTSVSVHRASAIRVLTRIVDSATLSGIDRYLRQAIIDPSSDIVSSSALVSGYHLVKSGGGRAETVKRWVGEIQTALKSTNPMVQFHALTLHHAIKSNDNLAVSRLLSGLMRGGLTSPLGICMLIRYAVRLIRRDSGALDQRKVYDFFEQYARHPNEMVMLEAARAMCEMPGIGARDVAPAVSVLNSFLSYTKPAVRLAAVRTLNKLARTMAPVVARANEDLQLLITDNNRTIATYAITTLLRTGSGGEVDHLLKQIGSFMGELNSEFKVVVVQSIHDLCLRMPEKSRALLSFLATAVRDEGGFEVKRSIVDAMIHIMERIATTKLDTLFHLCEFIEDCEYSSLSVRVLHLLGDVGPTMPRPAAFIRFVYNRTILEKAVVRAAAVTALAKFAARVASLRPSILVLLRQCREDDDDEVRDRATLYLRALERVEAEAGEAEAAEHKEGEAHPAQDASPAVAAVHGLTRGTLPLSVQALQHALTKFQLKPTPGAFSFRGLDLVDVGGFREMDYFTVAQEAQRAHEAQEAASAEVRAETGAGAPSTAGAEGRGGEAAGGGGGGGAELPTVGDDEAVQKIRAIEGEEFADLGSHFRSTPMTDLTEAEVEYVVRCRRHVFARAVVFDFEVRNTVTDVQLDDVEAEMKVISGPEVEAMWGPPTVAQAQKVRAGSTDHVYVLFRPRPEAFLRPSAFSVELKFGLVDVDPDTGEELSDPVPEDYPLEDITVTIRDVVAPVAVQGFRSAWDELGKESEKATMLRLPMDSVAKAVSKAVPALGLAPSEGTGAVSSTASKHQVVLAGTMQGGVPVLARLQVMLQEDSTCAMKVTVRTPEQAVARALLELLE